MIPLYAFDGYAAELAGERIEIGQNATDHMLLSVKAGMEGDLRIWFEGKAYWKVFDGISLATLLGLIYLSLRSRRCAAKA